MDLSSGSGKLSLALKNLRLQWERAKMAWNDSVRQEFEENYWQPLEQEIARTLTAIGTLNQAVIKSEQDCR